MAPVSRARVPSPVRPTSTRWIHLYEEDRNDGEVYGLEGGEVPLSRRPRERIELRSDGTAILSGPGADDRLTEYVGHWTPDGDSLIIRVGSRGQPTPITLRATRVGPDRLVVKR